MVEAPLGAGGAATVYRARDEQLGGLVAIKLYPPNRVSEAEFRREAAIAMRMQHPNLVALIDAGSHERQPYLALEFVDGPNLRSWLASRRDEGDDGEDRSRDVLEIARQIFLALDAMHRRGMAHGDIKPDNAIIQGGVVRIVDFGRARLRHLVGQGDGLMFPGTPAYMHPLLYQGGVPEARTDCFAAWVTTYELLAGHRPYTMGMLQYANDEDLVEAPPLSNPDLDDLVRAGLLGRLSDARSSWLAITRSLKGQTSLPRPRPASPPIDEQRVRTILEAARRGRSLALVGDPDATHPHLEALDRMWRATGGHSLWVHSSWASADRPMSGALALAAHAADALPLDELGRIDRVLGPLGAALAAAEPSARAWITARATGTGRPEPERIALGLRRFIEAAPRPLLVLVAGLGRIDGSSRRFLGSLVASGRVTVIGEATPDAPHGLPGEIGLESPADDAATGALSKVSADLLRCARLLNLPYGPLLARATGTPEAVVADAALEAEAAGLARYNGDEVLAQQAASDRDGQTLAGDIDEQLSIGREIFRDAARRLSADEDPIRVARYALRGDDSERLAEVLDAAVAEALRLDPFEALALLAADPRPPTPARLLRHMRVALLARDLKRAEELLATLRARDDIDAADLAESEAELAFRQGHSRVALEAYLRAAAALGRPLRGGRLGAVQDVVAVAQLIVGSAPSPHPNARLARVYEHLYDLWFCVDHGPLVRVYRRWLAAAPTSSRAGAMLMLWHTAFGQERRARAIETELFAGMDEERDPTGAAVVILHRGMMRLLRGDTAAAFSDGVDAAERLLSMGDPYLAALATTVPTTSLMHLANPGPVRLLWTRLEALVAMTGDNRGRAWARGTDATLRWSWGDGQGAIERAEAWAAESAAIGDAGEGVARRFLADLHVEAGRHRAALEELQRCDAVCARAHLRMDFTDARAINWLIADAQARINGQPGVQNLGRWRRKANALAKSSPRWTPRVMMASAWQRRAAGDMAGAANLFHRAETEAHNREQAHDAWLVLMHQARALNDEDAFEAAGDLAKLHGIKGGEPVD